MNKKELTVDTLRHSEYYNMQSIFDELYADSKNGCVFNELMTIILSEDNILLAYRNIKNNHGSKTPGVDNLNIQDIGRLSAREVIDKVRYIVMHTQGGYKSKPVLRKEIPKSNGKTRPLGIPCIWDRLIQQCIKQVLEPICEAKFHPHSYGFRPNRATEHAIARSYQLMQNTNLHYVVEFDIESFFDNVNHSKLIKQLWSIGIRDTTLIWIIKKMLKAPIKMPDGSMVIPKNGTPQGGILSPLLANIVLNELDWWVSSQWETFKTQHDYGRVRCFNNSTRIDQSNKYRALKNTKLKEMYIVRYADDFRIFCRTYDDAQNVMISVTKWLTERLSLNISSEKTRIVNVKEKYLLFLGFKIKVQQRKNKYTIISHVDNDAYSNIQASLIDQIKNIAKPRTGFTERDEVLKYNAMVLGIQNYYSLATMVAEDFGKISWHLERIFKNRLGTQNSNRYAKHGRCLSNFEKDRYGKSNQMRFISGCDEPIYPLGYIKHKNPHSFCQQVCSYTGEGRKKVHNNLQINCRVLIELMKSSLTIQQSVEYADNRLSLFSAQQGKCAITGIVFDNASDIHCHHIIPKQFEGNNSYSNLILILEPIHKLIHATKQETIDQYLCVLNLTKEQIQKINYYRLKANIQEIG